MHSWIIAVWFALLGLGIGSFLNVVIDRLPAGGNLNGRSHCDFCKRTLVWYDLIPVLSYLFISGSCRYCKKKLSIQYPIVELLTALLFFSAYVLSPVNSIFLLIAVLCVLSLSVVIAFTDFRFGMIPDWAVVSMFLIGFLLHANNVVYFLAGAIIAVFFIWIIYHLSGGKAMGYGDVKLVAAHGLVLSLPLLFISLYIAFLTGGIVSIYLLLLRKKKLSASIPFGPFLSFGFVSCLFVSLLL